MLTSADFTSDEEISDYKINDQTIDMVGYVTHMSNNLKTTSKGKFKKFVLSNGSKRIQVIAWNELMEKLDCVTTLGSIVHASIVKAQLVKDEKFNSGNVKIELLVKDHTVITVYGTYSPTTPPIGIEDMSLLEAYEKVGSHIRVDAVVKSEIGTHQHVNFVSTVASLTTTEEMLEVLFDFDVQKDIREKFLKGKSVEVVGIVKQYKDGPPILYIESSRDIKFLDRSTVAFTDIMMGFKTKSIPSN